MIVFIAIQPRINRRNYALKPFLNVQSSCQKKWEIYAAAETNYKNMFFIVLQGEMATTGREQGKKRGVL